MENQRKAEIRLSLWEDNAGGMTMYVVKDGEAVLCNCNWGDGHKIDHPGMIWQMMCAAARGECDYEMWAWNEDAGASSEIVAQILAMYGDYSNEWNEIGWIEIGNPENGNRKMLRIACGNEINALYTEEEQAAED